MAFQAGDEQAYETLYIRYVELLFEYGICQYHNKSFVEDALHNFYLELWKAKERLSVVSPIYPYLIKSFKRYLFARAKKQRRNINLSDTMVVTGKDHETDDTQEEAEFRNEKELAVQKALPKLSEKQQEIIHLKYYSGLSYNEIGEIMGMNIKSVYNLMFQAINQLRKHVDDLILIGGTLLWLTYFLSKDRLLEFFM
ncbi:RNA polymerase sigma factor [Sinomicrobium weinanense]|uniref:RNA polymerase sigma factor n=1 Tax=Sinomicrobium weinanense TaxID=2842200 RepID=UPI001C0B74F8|nr:sigma-70 family RNA polymerase sigma factor [Sinomicrobium weinanense]MBU3122907.1 sigma-70 family RNA polymerase sigma factor [Sinomicrobium weinanense]